MIKKTTFFFACLFLFACSEKKKEEIPSSVLPTEKMAEVMMDVHLLEATMTLNTYNADRLANGNAAPPIDIFSKHKITKKQYQESFSYYSKHPDLLNEVYATVLEDLSKMQAEVMNKKEEVKAAIDTVKIVVPPKKEKKLKALIRKKGKL